MPKQACHTCKFYNPKGPIYCLQSTFCGPMNSAYIKKEDDKPATLEPGQSVIPLEALCNCFNCAKNHKRTGKLCIHKVTKKCVKDDRAKYWQTVEGNSLFHSTPETLDARDLEVSIGGEIVGLNMSTGDNNVSSINNEPGKPLEIQHQISFDIGEIGDYSSFAAFIDGQIDTSKDISNFEEEKNIYTGEIVKTTKIIKE